MKKIEVTVEKTSTGYSAYANKLSVATTGSDVNEIRKNMLEALNLLFEDEGVRVKLSDISFRIDLQQFFTFYNVINAKGLAQRINMNYTLLNQYIQGKKTPSPKQVRKIMIGIHEVGRELSRAVLV